MHVLMPLPAQDYDPTEVAVTWKVLTDAGHTVSFATPAGQMAKADPLMLHGRGLDPWGWIPCVNRLKLLGLLLRANRDARSAHVLLQNDLHFQRPLAYEKALDQDMTTPFGALVLPGGHAKGMRTYLESATLQQLVVRFFELTAREGQAWSHRPVAAVCHGVLLAARSIRPSDGRSVLYGRRTTALPWALECSAWNLTRFGARFWDPGYYRTYQELAGEPDGYWSVESEVKRALQSESDFVDVSAATPNAWKKSSGLFRDSLGDDSAAWVVRDGRYLSARWPGDVHTFARALVSLLAEAKGTDESS